MAISRFFDGLNAFSEFCETLAASNSVILDATAGLASEMLLKKARSIFGNSDKLADLAQATQDEREALGYTPNDPLLRDGALLRDSVKAGHEGALAGVGSSEPVMLYHELGYLNRRTGRPVPPRPVFKITIEESAPDIEALAHESIGAMLGMRPAIKE